MKNEDNESLISQRDQKNHLISKEKPVDLDEILQLIGFGLYQQRIYIAMGLLGICEGAQIQIYTLVQQIQKQEFDMSQQTINISSSLLFFGFLFGSFTSGFLSDRYGRGRPCFIGTCLLTIFQLLICLSNNSFQLILYRSLNFIKNNFKISAYLIGLFAPLACTILTEITPSENRGKFMAILAISFSIGQLYGVYLAYLNLSNDFAKGNWRLLCFYSNFPCILSVIIQIFYMDESPRFELINGDIKKAFQIIDKMCLTNLKINLDLIKIGVREDLSQWREKQQMSINDVCPFFELLSKKYRKITLILWYNWTALSFSYFGMILYIPNILKFLNIENKMNYDNKEILISILFEILGLVFGAMIIDLKIFGRKNSMIMLFFLCSIASLLSVAKRDKFILYVTICKIILNNIMNFCFQYTSEIYPTQIRTSGIGVANGVGKCTGIVMPFICGYLENYYVGSSFFLFSILQLFAVFTTYNLPYDTTGISLDKPQEIIIKENSYDYQNE